MTEFDPSVWKDEWPPDKPWPFDAQALPLHLQQIADALGWEDAHLDGRRDLLEAVAYLHPWPYGRDGNPRHTCEWCCQQFDYVLAGVSYTIEDAQAATRWWKIRHPIRWQQLKGRLALAYDLADDAGK